MREKTVRMYRILGHECKMASSIHNSPGAMHIAAVVLALFVMSIVMENTDADKATNLGKSPPRIAFLFSDIPPITVCLNRNPKSPVVLISEEQYFNERCSKYAITTKPT